MPINAKFDPSPRPPLWHIEFRSSQFPPPSTSVRADHFGTQDDDGLLRFFRRDTSRGSTNSPDEMVLVVPVSEIRFVKQIDDVREGCK